MYVNLNLKTREQTFTFFNTFGNTFAEHLMIRVRSDNNPKMSITMAKSLYSEIMP